MAAAFVHRKALNGGVVSICLKCFLTVGRGVTAEDLLEQEEAHVCDTNLTAIAERVANMLRTTTT